MLGWWPTAGRRTSNALIPNVVRKAVNAEARATLCNGEEPTCEREQDMRTERDRDRHQEYVSIQGVQKLQNDNNQLKDTKSLYIVTHLGQLP